MMQTVNDGEGEIDILDNPGGTSISFMSILILTAVRSQMEIILALAFSAIVVTLLPGEITAHTASICH